MAVEDNPITPTEADLAFFVAADRLHGYERIIPAHVRYWTGQLALARDRVEPAREDTAGYILDWVALGGKIEAGTDPTILVGHGGATAEHAEGWRRTILGGLAASVALRRGFAGMTGLASVKGRLIDLTQPFQDGLAISSDEAGGLPRVVSDLTIDGSDPREWPNEPRFHIGFPSGEIPVDSHIQDVWFRHGPLLVCRRYPADVTPGTEDVLLRQGIVIDTERAVTVIPHMIALHSPQFAV